VKTETESVIAHYARDQLMDRVRSALIAAGYDPENPTVEMLSELDHLHGGGLASLDVELQPIDRRLEVIVLCIRLVPGP
jgi:hypothetical protein